MAYRTNQRATEIIRRSDYEQGCEFRILDGLTGQDILSFDGEFEGYILRRQEEARGDGPRRPERKGYSEDALTAFIEDQNRGREKKGK